MRKFNIWGNRAFSRFAIAVFPLPVVETITWPRTAKSNILEYIGHGNLYVCPYKLELDWCHSIVLLPQIQHKDSSIRS